MIGKKTKGWVIGFGGGLGVGLGGGCCVLGWVLGWVDRVVVLGCLVECWVVGSGVPSLLLRGAAFLLLLRIVVFSPLGLWARVFFLGTSRPKRGEEGSTTKRRRRESSLTRKGWEGKQHH